jgi:predicted DNA-binding transcriptional regulator AlpA
MTPQILGLKSLEVPDESTLVGSRTVNRYINTEDVIDAQGVAELLGLAQRNTVSSYQRRYPGMPRPVIDLGQGRCKLWLRAEIEKWQDRRDRPMVKTPGR